MNTRTLVLHSSAFVLYLLSTVVFIASWDFYLLDPTPVTFAIFGWLYATDSVVSAIAQVLLCTIFWKLAAPENSVDRSTLESAAPMQVEDLNEEDEI